MRGPGPNPLRGCRPGLPIAMPLIACRCYCRVQARQLAQTRVPADTHARVQAAWEAAQSEATELAEQLRELNAMRDKLSGRLDVMTPRPMWRKLHDHGVTVRAGAAGMRPACLARMCDTNCERLHPPATIHEHGKTHRRMPPNMPAGMVQALAAAACSRHPYAGPHAQRRHGACRPHVLQGGRRTAEIVHRVEERLGQYASELTESHAQVALAGALLQPEPLPAEVQLTLVADSSSCECSCCACGPVGLGAPPTYLSSTGCGLCVACVWLALLKWPNAGWSSLMEPTYTPWPAVQAHKPKAQGRHPCKS